ncbi:unnamed protein product [Closterium sp. NIES-53]
MTSLRRSGGSGDGGGGSSGSGGGRTCSHYGAVRWGVSGGGQMQLRRSQPAAASARDPLTQQLREWYAQHGASRNSARCPYVIRTGAQAEFGAVAELPQGLELLRQGVDIFALDYDAILTAMYALPIGTEGNCSLCVLPDPGIEAAALGASESALPGTAPAEALHTFTLDADASRCFFCDSTTLTPLSAPVPVKLADPSKDPVFFRSSTFLPCPAVLSGSLSGLHLPSFSMNMDRWHPLAPVASYRTRLFCGTTDLVTPPCYAFLACTPASLSLVFPGLCLPSHPCLPRPAFLASRGGSVPLLTPRFPRRLLPYRLSTSTKGEVLDVLIPWIRAVRLQLREQFRQDLPVLRLHSDRGGEFSSNLLRDFCRGEGILQSFTLLDSPQLNGIAERRIGLVMEVDPLLGTVPVEVAVDSSAAGGAEHGGAECEGAGSGVGEPGGAEPGGAEPTGVESRGAEREGVEPGGAKPRGTASSGGLAGASPRLSPRSEPLSPQQLREWFSQCTRLWSGAAGAGDFAAGDTRVGAAGAGDPAELGGAGAGGTGAGGAGVGDTGARGTSASGAGAAATPLGGAGVTVGAGGTRGAAAAGPGGARTRGTGASGTGSVGGAGAGDSTAPGAAGAGGRGAGGTGAGGAGAGGAGAGGAGAVGTRDGGTNAGGTGAGGARAVDPGAVNPGAGGAGARGAVSGGTGARGTVRPQPYFVPLLQQVLGVPSSLGVTPPLLCPPPDPSQSLLRPASALSRPAVLQSVVSLRLVLPPLFALSTAASALVAELVDFAAVCRLDYATALIAESQSASTPSVGGECVLGMDVLEEFECLAAAVPRFASMLLAPEGDPDAPDIPTPRSYAEAITSPYSCQWQAAMDAEMASWKSTGTYVDALPPSPANIVDGMWIFRVKRPPGSPPAFKALPHGDHQRFSIVLGLLALLFLTGLVTTWVLQRSEGMDMVGRVDVMGVVLVMVMVGSDEQQRLATEAAKAALVASSTWLTLLLEAVGDN